MRANSSIAVVVSLASCHLLSAVSRGAAVCAGRQSARPHTARHTALAPAAEGDGNGESVLDRQPPDLFVSDNVLCYSCMSKFYESTWPLLSNVYVKPVNFSDACNFAPESGGEGAQRGIGLVRCPSVCIKMYEQAQIGGFHVSGFVRGCYDNLLRHGWNETIVQWYRWLARDSCHVYSRKHILKLPHSAPDGQITICTCYADGCNGSPRLSGAPAAHIGSALCRPAAALAALAIVWPLMLRAVDAGIR